MGKLEKDEKTIFVQKERRNFVGLRRKSPVSVSEESFLSSRRQELNEDKDEDLGQERWTLFGHEEHSRSPESFVESPLDSARIRLLELNSQSIPDEESMMNQERFPQVFFQDPKLRLTCNTGIETGPEESGFYRDSTSRHSSFVC